MNRFIFFITALYFYCDAALALNNDAFSKSIAGISSVKYSEYEPFRRDYLNCATQDQLERPICVEVSDKVAELLNQAFSHSVLIAEFSAEKKPFCSDEPGNLVINREYGQIASYAMLAIEGRLKYGSSLYGAELPNTYLSKIIFDSLVAEFPCKK